MFVKGILTETSVTYEGVVKYGLRRSVVLKQCPNEQVIESTKQHT